MNTENLFASIEVLFKELLAPISISKVVSQQNAFAF